MFEISPVSFQKHPQNGNKQKITVVDMASTTVTDLIVMKQKKIQKLKKYILYSENL